MIYKFLYRALRHEEIDNGNVPIPRSQKPFKNHPRLGLASARLPLVLGETEENAVIHHQTDSERFPTTGISTTPNIDIAKKYAQKNHVIIKINAENIKNNGIKAYLVKEWVKHKEDILYPEDDEVILVIKNSSNFPKALIEKIIILD